MASASYSVSCAAGAAGKGLPCSFNSFPLVPPLGVGTHLRTLRVLSADNAGPVTRPSSLETDPASPPNSVPATAARAVRAQAPANRPRLQRSWQGLAGSGEQVPSA